MSWSRREALLATTAAVATACGGPEPQTPDEPATAPLAMPEGATLVAVVDRLLPGSATLPSALDAQVAVSINRELQGRLAGPMADEVRRGLREADTAAGGSFAGISAADQDALLARFQKGDKALRPFNSARWFEIVLTLALEGYLGHPRNGGNPDRVTWKALGLRWPH